MSKILPPTYFKAFFVLQVFLHIYFPIIDFITRPYNLIGLFFLFFGIAINIWAWRLFRQSKAEFRPTQKPTSFVTQGPFKFSRNPMYLGMVSILLGVAILLGSIPPFIFPILMFFILHFNYIKLEEKTMEKQFKDEYLVYKKFTHKWI